MPPPLWEEERRKIRLEQSTAIKLLYRKLKLDERSGRRTLPISTDADLPKLDAPEVSVNEYLSIIGSCLRISMVSRPDITYEPTVFFITSYLWLRVFAESPQEVDIA